jgi:hypothetical protein
MMGGPIHLQLFFARTSIVPIGADGRAAAATRTSSRVQDPHDVVNHGQEIGHTKGADQYGFDDACDGTKRARDAAGRRLPPCDRATAARPMALGAGRIRLEDGQPPKL